MQKVSDFHVLPISYSSQATHYMYIRAHAARPKSGAVDPLSTDRTLFAVNIPPDSTERELKTLFGKFGTVERVSFAGHDRVQEILEEEEMSSDEEECDEEREEDRMDEDDSDDEDARAKKQRTRAAKEAKVVPKITPLPVTALRILRRTGSVGHIVFTSPQHLKASLAIPAASLPLHWPKFKTTSSAEPSGLAHYIARHRALRPPLAAVKEHADSSMEVFEYKQAQASKRNSKYHKGEAIVDEDGFTLVTRGGAYGQTLGGGVGVASKKFMRELDHGGRKRKKKPLSKEGFYAFQLREKRIKGGHLAILIVRYLIKV